MLPTLLLGRGRGAGSPSTHVSAHPAAMQKQEHAGKEGGETGGAPLQQKRAREANPTPQPGGLARGQRGPGQNPSCGGPGRGHPAKAMPLVTNALPAGSSVGRGSAGSDSTGVGGPGQRAGQRHRGDERRERPPLHTVLKEIQLPYGRNQHSAVKHLCARTLTHSVLSDSSRPHGLTVPHQTPPSLEFSRQEYWSRLPFPTPRDLPDPGI